MSEIETPPSADEQFMAACFMARSLGLLKLEPDKRYPDNKFHLKTKINNVTLNVLTFNLIDA